MVINLNAELDNSKKVAAICPMCNETVEIKVTTEDISRIKASCEFVQKGVAHRGHVAVLYVDPQYRVRRTYAYDLENLNSNNSETMPTDLRLDDSLDLPPAVVATLTKIRNGQNTRSDELQSGFGALVNAMTKQAKRKSCTGSKDVE